MKAAVYERYGPPEVVELRDVPKPVPEAGEVLIRVRATTVSSGDWRARSLELPRGYGPLARLIFGIGKPRQPILGWEVAGVIESVGAGVTRFAPGDAVFAFFGFRRGAHVEYKVVPEDGAIARKPASLTFDEAAALSFGGITALHFLRNGGVKSGERVLVNGASGCVGSAAVQIARHMGAEVTGVCSGANADMVRALGAQRVIDYTRDDFAASGESWDVIVDCAGTAPYPRSRSALRDGGRLLLVLSDLPAGLLAPWVSLTSRHKVFAGGAPTRAEDLRTLAELAERGAFRPFIDRRYPFAQIVEAHRYVDTGRKRGSVVVTLA